MDNSISRNISSPETVFNEVLPIGNALKRCDLVTIRYSILLGAYPTALIYGDADVDAVMLFITALNDSVQFD